MHRCNMKMDLEGVYSIVILTLLVKHVFSNNCDCGVKKSDLFKLKMEIYAEMSSLIAAEGTGGDTSKDSTINDRIKNLESEVVNLREKVESANEGWTKAEEHMLAQQHIHFSLLKAWERQKNEILELRKENDQFRITFSDKLQNPSELQNKTLKQLEIVARNVFVIDSDVRTLKTTVDKLGNQTVLFMHTTEDNMTTLKTETERQVKHEQNMLVNTLEELRFQVYTNLTDWKNKTADSFQHVLDFIDGMSSSGSKETNGMSGLRSAVGTALGTDFPEAISVAFTAYGSKAFEVFSTSTIRFDHELVNVGNHFNHTFGVFVCPKSGIYHFSVTLTKQRADIDLVTAYLMVEGIKKLQLHSDPDDHGTTDFGSYPISGSATFSLQKGNWVYVAGNSANFYDDKRSFFSGFLLP